MIKKILLGLIYIYQKAISPYFGNCCRFHPTCSNYAIDVLKKYNIFKALTLICWRILRCNPLCEGGNDPA